MTFRNNGSGRPRRCAGRTGRGRPAVTVGRPGALAALLVVGAALVLAGCGGDGAATAPKRAAAAPTDRTATPRAAADASGTGPADDAPVAGQGVWPTSTKDLRRASYGGSGPLAVHAEPSATSRVVVRLDPRTTLGSRRVLLAGETRSGFVRVSLPRRPNGGWGWVDVRQVALSPVPGEVRVDLAARRMTVVLGGRTVNRTPVAVGSAANPTPRGVFFVTDRVRPPKPDGAYGAFALGLSGYSPTLTEFNGADGQIGIHGTNDPSSIGKPVSHGCIRVPDAVAQVLEQLPLGTPVVVV